MMLDLSNKRYGEKRRDVLRGLRGHPGAERRAAREHRRADRHDLPPAHGEQAARRHALLLHERQREDCRRPRRSPPPPRWRGKKAEDQLIEMEIDGEMQADAALLPDLAERKAPTSLVAGRANVLIFPDLNSGNIAAKLVQYLAGAETYGQILLGLSKPCADLSRGATEDDILGVAAICGLQAIEYRKLYPTAQTAV